MADERTRAERSATTCARDKWTLEDVLAQPSPDPNDDLPNDQWATKNADVAERLAEIANRLRQSTPMRASKKQAAFLQVAVVAETNEPLGVKALALAARSGDRTYRNDSDAKRTARELCANGGPLFKTPAGLVLQTTRRKAPLGVSWHDLTELQRQLLIGLSHEVVDAALMPKAGGFLQTLRQRRGIGGPTLAKLAGVRYRPTVAKLLRDLVDMGILRRLTPRRIAAGRWPSDAPFRPHPFLREEQDQPLRQSELRRQLQEREAQRNALQVAFRATYRAMRAAAPESAP